jgi:hypothetical protein
VRRLFLQENRWILSGVLASLLILAFLAWVVSMQSVHATVTQQSLENSVADAATGDEGNCEERPGDEWQCVVSEDGDHETVDRTKYRISIVDGSCWEGERVDDPIFDGDAEDEIEGCVVRADR